MRRTTIKPKKLYELAREYLSTRHIPAPNSKGGRPRDYDDALILTIASIQNLNQYSFREALEYCEDYFADLPVLSTYHDRLSKFTSIEYTGKKIVSLTKPNTPQKGRVFIVDGTGFSYYDVYPMKFFNGMDIRKIKTHVKVGALIGLAKNKRFVVSAGAGKSYTGDTTLVQPLLEKLTPGQGYVLGDKGFDSHRIMETIIKKGYCPAIDIKQGYLKKNVRKIKDPLRLQSKKNADNEKIYNKRTLIEGLFGNIKQKLSSHVRVFKLEIAKVFALLRFALLNISVLVRLEKAILWIWFPNSAMLV